MCYTISIMFSLYRQKDFESDIGVVSHQGMFKRQLSLWQGVALITSGTIGAGILGIPYAVAQVGAGIGILYILGLGLLMMGLNILIGEVAIRAGKDMQLAGLAEKYLGKTGKHVMTLLMYTMLFGVLTVYIIGEGRGLSALFGGSEFWWSIGFFVVAFLLILVGMNTVKTVELFLCLGVLSVVLLLSAFSIGDIEFVNFGHINLANLFLPYGIILFAFHGTTTIPEAHSLLKDRERTFREAIIISSFIVMIVYVLFTLAVIGVTGKDTTEIATIGLGNAVGPAIFLLGNLFAVLAMGTSFLVSGLALRDSLRWDFSVPRSLAAAIACYIPLILFIIGVRGFIETIEVIGGVFMSFEMLLLVLIYYRSRHAGHATEAVHAPASVWLFVGLLTLALSAGGVYSVISLL